MSSYGPVQHIDNELHFLEYSLPDRLITSYLYPFRGALWYRNRHPLITLVAVPIKVSSFSIQIQLLILLYFLTFHCFRDRRFTFKQCSLEYAWWVLFPSCAVTHSDGRHWHMSTLGWFNTNLWIDWLSQHIELCYNKLWISHWVLSRQLQLIYLL